eukprot:8838883-Alexandrium_andersonii.AAC.1
MSASLVGSEMCIRDRTTAASGAAVKVRTIASPSFLAVPPIPMRKNTCLLYTSDAADDCSV